jgi:hypothetical protein
MAPLFSKPTIGEYEDALRKASAVDALQEVFREDPYYRASAIKEINARAKWAGLPVLRWIFCELRDALEKYEAKPKQPEAPKTEHPVTDALREMYERNQVKGVQEPFFGGTKPNDGSIRH